MKTIDDYQVGDVILRRNTGFLPKGIQFFMNIYRKKKGYPKTELYNHAMIVVDLWGTKWIADSAEHGVTVHNSLEEYMNNPNTLHLTWKQPLSAEEKKAISAVAVGYAIISTRYDFINFYDQIVYIVTGKWKGKTGDASRKRVYCSEMVAICMDDVRASFKGRTWDKNPMDIQMCEDLIVK